MRIYRVEHAGSGLGPYHHGEGLEYLRIPRAGHRPTLDMESAFGFDVLGRYAQLWFGREADFESSKAIYFGFATPLQLAMWWGDDTRNGRASYLWDALAINDFGVAVYEVSPRYAAVTQTQAIFAREFATLVDFRELHVTRPVYSVSFKSLTV